MSFTSIKGTNLFTEALYRIHLHERVRNNAYLTANTMERGGKSSWDELDTESNDQMWALVKSEEPGEYLLKPLSSPAFNLMLDNDHFKTISGKNDGSKKERWIVEKESVDGKDYITLNNVKHHKKYLKGPKPKGGSDGNRKRLVFEPVYQLSVSNLEANASLEDSGDISSSVQPTAQVKQVNESSEAVEMNFSYELEETSSITLTSTKTLHVGYTESLSITSGVDIEFAKEESTVTMSFTADFTTENSTAKTESETQKYTISGKYIVPGRSVGYMDVTVGENVSVDQGIQLKGDLSGRLARINTNTSNSYIYETVAGKVLKELCIFEHKINPGFIYSKDLSKVTIDSNVSGQAKLGYVSTFRTVSLDS